MSPMLIACVFSLGLLSGSNIYGVFSLGLLCRSDVNGLHLFSRFTGWVQCSWLVSFI
jgi:hypothetical protein